MQAEKKSACRDNRKHASQHIAGREQINPAQRAGSQQHGAVQRDEGHLRSDQSQCRTPEQAACSNKKNILIQFAAQDARTKNHAADQQGLASQRGGAQQNSRQRVIPQKPKQARPSLLHGKGNFSARNVTICRQRLPVQDVGTRR